MKSYKTQSRVRHGLGFLALTVVFGQALAEGEDVAALIKPDSSISAGLGGVSGSKEDRAVFGQYNGMRKNRGQLQLDIDVNKRDEASGTWTTLIGRNLGNENREFSFGQQKQGDWRYFLEYGELVRNYSNTINTNMGGIGTNNLVVNVVGNPAATPTAAGLKAAQGTGSNVDLKTTRKSLGLGADNWLTPNLQLEATFKNEDKTGARIFGRTATCGTSATTGYGPCTASFGTLLMLPEPINSTTKQFELKLNFSDEKLTLSGAYYGSFFKNNFGALNINVANPANLWNPDGSVLTGGAGDLAILTRIMQLPIALPPDNQSHQFSVAGTYAITPSTRATFKYGYTRLTQNESFSGMGLAGAPRNSLDALVSTSVLQAGITSRPMPKLTLVANLRYENKDDKTPIDMYRAANTNSQSSHKKAKAKLEASYQLPDGYRATAGIDYDMRDLGQPAGTNDTSQQAYALRAKNDEVGYRFELRKSLTETVSGAVSVGHSARTGSAWMLASNGPAPTFSTATQSSFTNLFPLFWMDLKRQKVKGSMDWAATDKLSFQASAEAAAELYDGPSQRGARDGKTTSLNLDASYAISDTWKMNGWYSRGDTILDINGTSGAYKAGLRQLGHNLGLGVRGAPSSTVEVGADFTFSYEVNRTAMGFTGRPTTPIPVELATAAFRQLNLNIYSKYALDKNADIRVNLVHQRYYSNEWFWNNDGNNFFFTDGTTVTQKNQQNVSFIGASYIYKFQ